jgi:hypothetical protein
MKVETKAFESKTSDFEAWSPGYLRLNNFNR